MNREVEKGFLPRIGAQFFINADDTFEDTERHFALMKQYGIRMVRLFVLWEHIEPKEGIFTFERYDIAYDLAQKYDIKIVSTLTCEDPPQWFEEKPFYHHYSNLNDSRLKQYAAIYIEKLVSRYYNHPAQYAWILMNEPEVKVNFEQSTMHEFAKWLEQKYQTVEHWNKNWYRQYNGFLDVKINPSDSREYWQCFDSFVDWNSFLKDNLVTQLNWIKAIVKKIDQTSPIHLNPKGFFGNLAPVGQDYWKEGEVADILGASIHPAWKFLWFERADYGIAYAFCVDLIRSASNGKSFWVTELQSGATLMTGIQPCTPSPQELSAWLWDSVGAGAKSVVYWMWHPRTMGQEAGEWGIVTADHKVSKRLKASSGVTDVIENNAELFQNAQVDKPKVAIYYNHATEILALIEGSPLYRMPEAPIQSLAGLYKALVLSGVSVDFICADQIRNEKLNEYELLYLPYSYALDSDVQEQVKEFVRVGGKLWAEAPCGWKDSQGRIHRNQILSEVFGAEVIEYRGSRMDDQVANPYLCQAELGVKTASVISTFPDGEPAVIHNQYNKGEAMFVATVPSLGFFDRKEEQYASQIIEFAKAYQSNIAKLETTNGHIIQRSMHSADKTILIIENWGKAIETNLVLCNEALSQATNLLTNESVKIDNDKIKLTLKQNETVVYVLE
ncbi:beta-galactosidase [Paludicola sp. MB14-C6]|uniref:beta-galactosidase n=1 Tax=Paludihabitans sp. MB14-C6 TaxID=3070656 RepID=UPI0027DBB1DE|nr:beta-galactosidase [Paludicola sp. MB14-C6]WMJ22419.1 beta-galactosidase [Paludicola sp. MB14-C6]